MERGGGRRDIESGKGGAGKEMGQGDAEERQVGRKTLRSKAWQAKKHRGDKAACTRGQAERRCVGRRGGTVLCECKTVGEGVRES